MTTEHNDLYPKKDGEETGSATRNQATVRTSTLASTRVKVGFSFSVVTLVLAYFAFTAFQGATVDYLSVAETVEESTTDLDRVVGVSGKLVQNSYVRDPDGLTAYFALKDENGSEELQVVYRGEIGQVFFNDHSQIILQGQKLGDGLFEAQHLTVRCPSKYLTEAEQAELEAEKNGKPVAPPYQPDYFDREA